MEMWRPADGAVLEADNSGRMVEVVVTCRGRSGSGNGCLERGDEELIFFFVEVCMWK